MSEPWPIGRSYTELERRIVELEAEVAALQNTMELVRELEEYWRSEHEGTMEEIFPNELQEILDET